MMILSNIKSYISLVKQISILTEKRRHAQRMIDRGANIEAMAHYIDQKIKLCNQKATELKNKSILIKSISLLY